MLPLTMSPAPRARFRDRGPDRMVAINVLLTAVSCGWFVLALAGLRGPLFLGWAPFPVIAVLTTVLCLKVATAAHRRPAMRSFWRSMAAAAALTGIGGASEYRDVLVSADAVEFPLGPLTLIAYVGVGVAVVRALVRLPVNRITRSERITVGLDAATVMLGAMLFIWYFVTSPALRTGLAPDGVLLAALAITALPLVLVFILMKLSLSGTSCIDRGALRLLALSLAVAAVGSMPQPFLTDDRLMVAQYVGPLGCLLLTAAARRQSAALRRPAPARPHSRIRRPFGILPYAAVAAINVLLISTVMARQGLDRLVIAVGAVAVTALVVARQLIAISENTRLLRRLDHETMHDALTRLPNRNHFKERLRRALNTSDSGWTVSVALIDLDEFKTVNDTLGHTIGDDLLVAVARRLRDEVRPGVAIARLGGDEFALILDGIAQGEVDLVLRRLLASLNAPFVVRGHELKIDASVGVSNGRSGDAPGELLRHADVAMYAAKAKGGGVMHYLPGMETGLLDQVRLYDELREAVNEGQLRLHYQPLVTLPAGHLIGVEALVRWVHPVRGLLAPAAFVPLAERTGAIMLLGHWVLQEACRQSAEWQAQFGRRAPTMNVNVSPRQLKEAAFAAEAIAVIEHHGLDPSSITIEVTETSTVTDQISLDNLRRLHEFGVRIALDDFGTAQSSLSLLHACPVDELKLDRAFAQAVRATGDNSVAGAVIQLARTFGLEVVAEGTETQEQADWLYGLGYRVAQGYHFGRPMPPESLTALIAAAGSDRPAGARTRQPAEGPAQTGATVRPAGREPR